MDQIKTGTEGNASLATEKEFGVQFLLSVCVQEDLTGITSHASLVPPGNPGIQKICHVDVLSA